MKNLLIGLLVVGSHSTFALTQNCQDKECISKKIATSVNGKTYNCIDLEKNKSFTNKALIDNAGYDSELYQELMSSEMTIDSTNSVKIKFFWEGYNDTVTYVHTMSEDYNTVISIQTTYYSKWGATKEDSGFTIFSSNCVVK